MANIPKNIKQQISLLSKNDLEKLVLKAANTDKTFCDFLIMNYGNAEEGEQYIFEKAKSEIGLLFCKGYRGRSDELRSAKMLAACSKRINEFSKVCKNKRLEADLIIGLLDELLDEDISSFGTCFTAFDYKFFLLVKRLVNLVTTKIQEDYRIDYKEKVNKYLLILHDECRHLDYVYDFVKQI